MAAARRSFFHQVSSSRQNPSCARQGFSTGLARSIAARRDNILKELDEYLGSLKRNSVSRPHAIDYGAAEKIFEFVKSDDGTLKKSHFIQILEEKGLLNDDPRIKPILDSLKRHDESIQKNIFSLCMSEGIDIIENAFSDSNIIHHFDQFTEKISAIYRDCLPNEEGELSDYVPQLQKQNPANFAVSVCTVDGQRACIGNTNVNFPILGCHKPIAYCLAMEENGPDTVHNNVGREPSGVRFNALKVSDKGLPHNPLIESGALMISSMIKNKMVPADRFDYVMEKYSELMGGKKCGFNNSIYLSERSSSDRNAALLHFLRENKAFGANNKVEIDQVLEFYIQCKALTTNTNALAILAGSLANGGVCPLTDVEVFSAETVKNCLSMMFSCGMYDYSGEFTFTIGLPAKSSNSGVIMVVIPNVMGICTFSPRLDKFMNSTRGVDFFHKFITQFNFHVFDSIAMDKDDPRQAIGAESITAEKIVKFSSLGDLTALKRLRPMVEDLIEADYDHRTPLHLAASNGHLDVIRYIVDIVGEEEINPLDRWNGTPFDDAVREKHNDIAGFLSSFGGKPGPKEEKEVRHTLNSIVDEGSETSDISDSSDSSDDSNNEAANTHNHRLPSWQLQAVADEKDSQLFDEEDEVEKSL